MIDRLPDDGPFPQADIALAGALEARDRRRSRRSRSRRAFRAALAAGRERDRAAGRTLDGPHRADLLVRHRPKAMPAELCSTGEQKALLIGIVLRMRGSAARCPAACRSCCSTRSPPISTPAAAPRCSRSSRSLDCQAFMTGTEPSLFSSLRGRAQFLTVDHGSVAADRWRLTIARGTRYESAHDAHALFARRTRALCAPHRAAGDRRRRAAEAEARARAGDRRRRARRAGAAISRGGRRRHARHRRRRHRLALQSAAAGHPRHATPSAWPRVDSAAQCASRASIRNVSGRTASACGSTPRMPLRSSPATTSSSTAPTISTRAMRWPMPARRSSARWCTPPSAASTARVTVLKPYETGADGRAEPVLSRSLSRAAAGRPGAVLRGGRRARRADRRHRHAAGAWRRSS